MDEIYDNYAAKKMGVDHLGQVEKRALTSLPFNSQIKFVILHTVNHTIVMMLVQRIMYSD